VLDILFFAFPWYLPIEQPVEVRFANVFTDHAVLQRESTVPIWGSAIPDSKVKLKVSWQKRIYSATADARGRWMVKVPTMKAGGPHSMTVELGNVRQTVNDLVFGEVWVMGGQSNMEWMISWCAGGHPKLSHDEVKQRATDGNIRYFTVPKSMAPDPTMDVDAKWQKVSSETVDNCSAVGYYFATRLRKELGPEVPIGLLNCAYGGSEVEQWIPDANMRKIPAFNTPIQAYEKEVEAINTKFNDWSNQLNLTAESAPKDLGQAFDGYFSQRVTGDWGFDGLIWYRASFDVPKAMSGQLSIGFADYADAVWVNGRRAGQSLGEDNIRSYDVAAKEGKNEVVIAVLDLGGVGGLGDAVRPVFISGKRAYRLKDWRIKLDRNLKDLGLTPVSSRRWSRMYNGMIAPLAGYGIKGFAWYQGESNVGRGRQYEMALGEMIKSWRSDFGNKPFGIIQIAPYSGYGGTGVSADVREAMARLGAQKGNGLVVTTDLVDDYNDIHPRNKFDVGERLAMWALNEAYGRKEMPRGGPKFVAGKALPNGQFELGMDMPLELRGDPKSLFLIAGADQKFVPAEVRVEGNKLVVWSDAVAKPLAVRYNWTDDKPGNLFGKNGLPASNFRTDRWPVSTEKAGW
jgi:sialate O-acetylesterase